MEEAVPRLCHAVIVHLDGNQDGIFVGNFERWEGWTVGEAQQPGVGTVCRRRHLHSGRGRRPRDKIHTHLLNVPFNDKREKNSPHESVLFFLTWRSGRMPLCSTAPPQAGGASSWPASPVPSSSTAAWGSSGRTPAATPRTAPPSVSPPASPPRRLKREARR